MKASEQYLLLNKIYQDKLDHRYSEACSMAKLASKMLKTKYHANTVLLFGSLLYRDRFDMHSDIDLAVSGIPDEFFYKAVGETLTLVSPFDLDIVDIEDCRESIKKEILKEGVHI
jgi:uncharacterized protein